MVRLLLKYGLLGIISFYLFLVFSAYLDNPPVWPDEAYYADTAFNLLNEGRLGTDLWGDMVPGVRTNLDFYPPGLFYLFAGVFSVTGLSIYFQRLTAVFAGVGFLVVFYFICQRLISAKVKKSQNGLIALLAVLLLVTDNLFLRASRWSRPEIFILFLSYLPILLLFIAEDSKSKNRKFIFLVSGLFLGISLLFHLYAGIYVLAVGLYWLAKHRLKVLKLVESYYLFLPIILVFGSWIISIFPEIDVLFTQVGLQKLYREISPTYLLLVFNSGPIFGKIYFWIMLIILPISFWIARIKRDLRLGLMAVVLFFSWIYAYVGRIEGYVVLIVPISFLFLTLTIGILTEKKVKYFGLQVVCISTLTVVLSINVYLYTKNLFAVKSYRIFQENLKGRIPQDANVYLSSLPDAYFILKENTKGELYTFPALPGVKEEYIKVLNDSDYIVYNFNPGAMFFGDYLEKYLQLNTEEIVPVGTGVEYQFLIIKLVDKNLRRVVLESRI